MTQHAGRAWLRTLLVVAAIGAVSLAATEVILRVFAPLHFTGIQSSYIYDEEIGYLPRPGVHELQLTDFLQEVRTNGFGTLNYQETFDAYPLRVFTLGDSYTQGAGLPPDAAYPFQLDLELNTRDDGLYEPRVAVVNLGLAAFGGEQSLLVLRRYAKRLGAPAAVAYLGSDNDYDDDRLFEAGYRHRHLVYGSPRWEPFVGPLLWASHFEVFKRAKMALGALQRMTLLDGAEAGGAAAEPRGPKPSVAELSWPVIQKIHAECDALGADLVVSWANATSPSYAWLRERARAEGLAFADWWPRVESVRAVAPEAPVWNPHSGGHMRTWVNHEIAESYADALRPLLAGAPAPPHSASTSP